MRKNSTKICKSAHNSLDNLFCRKSDSEIPEILNRAEAVSPKRNKSMEPYSMIAKNKKVNKYDMNAMNKLKTAIQSKHSSRILHVINRNYKRE